MKQRRQVGIKYLVQEHLAERVLSKGGKMANRKDTQRNSIPGRRNSKNGSGVGACLALEEKQGSQ